MLKGSITIDIDTLSTHLKGQGLKRGEYDFLDFREGIDNFLRLLAEFDIKATFFVVGKDLLYSQNRATLLKIINSGHEVANHSMNHIQGFRFLSKEKKEKEIAEAEKIIFDITGKKTIGFRTPGWNISDDAIDILESREYLYDSSIFPSFLNPLLKIMHYTAMNKREKRDRTTLGKLRYSLAPDLPYMTSSSSFLKKDKEGLLELPVSVTPTIRIPFFATFLLKTGEGLFRKSYRAIKDKKRPIIYEFHLFDFVNFDKKEFADQIPSKGDKGAYIPQSIHTPFEKKWDLFRRAIEIMAKDYKFETMEKLTKHYLKENDSKA